MLEKSWHDLLIDVNADLKFGNEIFLDLKNTYSQATRKYHNWAHIQQVISTISEAQEIADSLPVILLSAWFHDYVCDAKAQDNELKSAIVAEEILNKLNICDRVIQTVKQIILSTQKHQPILDSIDNLILLDADLSILGTSPDSYERYSTAIRQEYRWLGDRDYQQGRKAVLTNFLSRKRIYYTDYFYQKLESSARRNLQAEVARYSRTNLY